MSVLVVDDVAVNRAVLRRLCLAAGAANVVEASDGHAAYQMYKAGGGPESFCLIFMDCNMPVMDGWQATTHIRMLEEAAGWQPVPIVAATTEDISAGSLALQRCWDCGMTAATSKPVSKTYVSQLLHHWAGGSGTTACSSSVQGSCFEMSGGSSTACSSGSPRSSMEAESACLPNTLRTSLVSAFFR